MTIHDLTRWATFGLLHTQNAALATVQNHLVSMRVHAKSHIATTNIAGDMWRETLELGIRRLEFKRHSIKQRRDEIGKAIIDEQ